MMLIMNFYDVISVFSDLYRELYDKLFTDHYDSEATPKLSRHTTFLPVHLGICRKEGLFGREHQVIARVNASLCLCCLVCFLLVGTSSQNERLIVIFLIEK